jgi:hypothetical protein
MHLCPLGQKTFPSTLSPPCQSRTAAFRFHAGPKAMLAFTRSLRSLVSAFHKANDLDRRD